MGKKKRKKKVSPYKNNKLSKAQHKKKFYSKVNLILTASGCHKIVSELTPENLDHIYQFRVLPFRFIRGSSTITNSILKSFSWVLTRLLQEKKFKIIENGFEISNYDILTVGLSVFYALKREGNFLNLNPEEKNQFIHDFDKLTKDDTGAFSKYFFCIQTICIVESDLTKQIPCFSNRFQLSEKNNVYDEITLNYYKPKSDKIAVDGFARTIYPVGWVFANEEFKHLEFNLEDNTIEKGSNYTSYKVFIQTHALNRMKERLDYQNPGHTHYYLYKSVNELKDYFIEKDTIYIAYYFFDCKTGYLTGNLIDDKLVIRTFLFITNNGTPEGKKLAELTGLMKSDKKYLALDKLSTFQNTNIRNEPEIIKLFKQVGCDALLNIKNDYGTDNTSDYGIASKILNYMKDTRKDYSTIDELTEAMQE